MVTETLLVAARIMSQQPRVVLLTGEPQTLPSITLNSFKVNVLVLNLVLSSVVIGTFKLAFPKVKRTFLG